MSVGAPVDWSRRTALAARLAADAPRVQAARARAGRYLPFPRPLVVADADARAALGRQTYSAFDVVAVGGGQSFAGALAILLAGSWPWAVLAAGRLAPWAIEDLMCAAESCPGVDAVYSDDEVDDSRTPVRLKPAWSPLLQATTGYAGPLLAVSRAVVRRALASQAELTDGQAVLASCPRPLTVAHVPRPLTVLDELPDRPVHTGAGPRLPATTVAEVARGDDPVALHAALAAARGPVLVVDAPAAAQADTGWADALASRARDPRIGTVAPVLLDRDGSIACAGVGVAPDGSLFGRAAGRPGSATEPGGTLADAREVTAAPSAAALVTRAALSLLDTIDPAAEPSVDHLLARLSLTAAASGLTTVVEPLVTIPGRGLSPAAARPSALAEDFRLLAGDPYTHPGLDERGAPTPGPYPASTLARVVRA